MKRIIALLVVLVFFSNFVFAVPVFTSDDSDLFADINASALTEEEAQTVEGEGFLGGLIGGIVAGVGFACMFIGETLNNPPKTAADLAGTVAGGVLCVGLAVVGGVGLGLGLPF
jgi:hypothetical protein